jgi:mono/diheme cytochrome c family protein
MMPVLLVSAVILSGLAVSSAAGRIGQDTAPAPAGASAKSPVKTTAESQAHAKKLYEVDCALCHNANGDGKSDLAKDMDLKLMDWTDPKSLATTSDKELFDIIRKGKGKMPAEEEGRAKDEAVWNLVVYIRSMSKNQPASADKPSN